MRGGHGNASMSPTEWIGSSRDPVSVAVEQPDGAVGHRGISIHAPGSRSNTRR
jgi:hypothetical protein